MMKNFNSTILLTMFLCMFGAKAYAYDIIAVGTGAGVMAAVIPKYLSPGLRLEGDFGNAGLSAIATVPFIGGFATTGKHAWKAEDVISSLGSKYTKSSPINGINIHKSYKVNDVIPDHYIKEYRGISGIRPDFVDLDNHLIYELKPANPNSILRGYRQLKKYKSLFDKYLPAETGEWHTILDLY